jgi:enolase-phosphatase E1
MKTILTDIEGTTSSISFVKDVLFPYAAPPCPASCAHGREPEVRHWLDQVAAENGGLCDDAMIVECCRAGSTRTASTPR